MRTETIVKDYDGVLEKDLVIRMKSKEYCCVYKTRVWLRIFLQLKETLGNFYDLSDIVIDFRF
mgnify:CR=1 FL=1